MPSESLGETPDLRAFLGECAALGAVRLVLRNCSGFMEMFCSTERLTGGDRWLTIRITEAHMHVELARVAGIRLRPSGDADTPARPSIWFHGRCGTPFLLVILDQTEGVGRAAQEAAFGRLRDRWGEEIVFDQTESVSARTTLH